MILVTGGAGYIGSHTCVALARAGHNFVVIDNFSNSTPQAVGRLELLLAQPVRLVQGDIRDGPLLDGIFQAYPISAVIHFAGLKAVGESVAKPLEYFNNNVAGSLSVLEAMGRGGCKTIVFSSSATVYGDAETMPITEDAPCSVTNPYGRTKLMVEEILRDLHSSDASWRIACLRYFNPVGADESGLIGESPTGNPSNLMPYVAQVAAGKKARLQVFGDDYPTPDGTGVRDYIHVTDLTLGHVAALDRLKGQGGHLTVNLGTGKGTSVLEMIKAFEKICGHSIPYEIVPRRPGDVSTCFANPQRARELLGWLAERDIDSMCRDAWRWEKSTAHQ